MITGLERFFNRPLTKFFLAFLIILSVLPLPEVRRFDLAFFAVFAAELAVSRYEIDEGLEYLNRALQLEANNVKSLSVTKTDNEMFVFDALPLSNDVVILQTRRSEEFSPVKNASGEDSMATCLHDQVRRSATWLEAAGARVPRDADGQIAAALEISPMLALDAADLAGKVNKDLAIKAGDEFYLE